MPVLALITSRHFIGSRYILLRLEARAFYAQLRMRSAILRITLKRSKEFRIRRSGSNCGCRVGREDIDIIETVDLFHNNDTKTELATSAQAPMFFNRIWTKFG